MSENGLNAAQKKMRDAGVAQQAIDVFSHYYRELENGATGLIPEDTIEPLTQIDSLDNVSVSPEQARDALSKTVLIKLNGGLGTSMGMDKAKSLLPVRDGKTFLDLIVGQVKAARVKYGVTLPHRGGGPAAGLPAEPGAEAACRRPDPGDVGGRPGAGVVPAGPR